MSTEENKVIVRAFIEGQTASGWRTSERHLDPGYTEHGFPPGYGDDLEGWRRLCIDWYAAVPDYRIEIHDLVAEGDRVAARVTLSGTRDGRRFSVAGYRFYRLAGGKIVESWGLSDQVGMQRQLGVLPAPLSPDH